MHKLRLTLLFLLTGNLFSSTISAQSSAHRKEALATDSYAYFVEHSNGYTMLSGDPSTIGPYTGSGIVTNSTSGQLDASWPKINGDVYAVVSDGQNGWYIGGDFYSIGDVEVYHLAHLKSDKTLDTNWKPDPAGSVYALAVEGNTLYVGGYFGYIAEEERTHLVAFDIPTGNLKSWNPDPDNYITTIKTFNNTVYVGGYFTTIGNASRIHLAALNNTDGAATAWNPSVSTSNNIYDIAVTSTAVFIGGYFSEMGGQACTSLAAVNKTDGQALAGWSANLGAFESASALAVSEDGNTLFVGGYFATIKNVARHALAAVSTTNGNVSSWNPNLNDGNYASIQDLDLSGNALYLTGYFSTVNSIERNGFAALSTTDASLLNWNINANNSGDVIAVSGNMVFAGGYLNGVNWQSRNGFALINESTNALWPYDLDLDGGVVRTIVVKDNTLYIGGQFASVNGQRRKNVAAINLTNGQVLSWAPAVQGTTSTESDNSVVNTMEIKDNLLYIGGLFLQINLGGVNTSRPNLAALDLTTGVPSNWNPVAGDGSTNGQYVNSIDISGNTVYVAGSFDILGKQPRAFLGAVDATTGAATSWHPDAVSPITKIGVTATTAYVLGDFSKGIAGAPGRTSEIAAIDLTSGLATSWDIDFPPNYGTVVDFALTSTDIYVAGYFHFINTDQERSGLASFSLSTGTLNDWNPDVGYGGEGDASVTAVAASSSRLYASGYFYNVGDESRDYYAEFDICNAIANITLNGSTLSAPAGGAAYQWYMNNEPIEGATSQNLDLYFAENGIYAVEVSGTGCTIRSDDYVYLITGQENDIAKSIKIYPNPAKEELFIEVPSQSTLTVLDMLGRPVKTAALQFGQKNRVDTQEMKSGSYVLMIRSGNTTNAFKIIKTY